MSLKDSKFGLFTAIATGFSLVACYGTLAAIGLLGTLGIAIALDEALWAGVIVAFAALAVVGLGLGQARHRRPWPALVGATGAAAIAYVMYGKYDRVIELMGFILLCFAAFWDWRLRRPRAPAPTPD